MNVGLPYGPPTNTHTDYYFLKNFFRLNKPLDYSQAILSYPSPSIIFKYLLLRNCLSNQKQILCGASMGRGKESLYKWPRPHSPCGVCLQDLDGSQYTGFLLKRLRTLKHNNKFAPAHRGLEKLMGCMVPPRKAAY